MKKLTLLLVMVFLFSCLVNGQDPAASEYQAPAKEKPSFWFGPKVGVNLSTPTYDLDEIRDQLETNYQAGFFMQFGRTVYFQPEFYYAVHKEGLTSTGQTRLKLETLEIPMMFGLRLINLGVVSAHIMAGPEVSILLKETRAPRTYGICRQSGNFSLQGGGGIDFLGFITLDVRYSVPMDNMVGSHINDLSWDSQVNVTLGLKLR